MFAALPLTALRAFESASRLLSFKAAAEELAVTPTAISHQIRSLEDWLGVALFERLPRQVRLTEGGEESQCGWLKDKFGVSWQITPRALSDAMAAGGGPWSEGLALDQLHHDVVGVALSPHVEESTDVRVGELADGPRLEFEALSALLR